MSVFIIGTGMGDTKTLTIEAEKRIKSADIIIGAKRVAQPFSEGKKVIYEYRADEIAQLLKENEYKNAAVLFSGDAGFFSGAKKLTELIPDAIVVAGVSCVSYFCARLSMPHDEMNIVSLHGRECNIVSEVRTHRRTFVLLGENPCGKLCDFKMGECEVYIGENLSYENEKITRGLARDFRDTKLEPLSVMVITNENYDARVRIGINDDEFITGGAPMTKREARAISLSSLEPSLHDVCWDIGAGTGSVSVEAALLCPRGRVYAIEKSADAARLIEENAVKFQTDNIVVVRGEAPDALEGLPKADKVFIGGSSGRLYEIIRACGCDSVVVNAITLETLETARSAFCKLGYEYSITQISAARAKKAGTYNMMTAQNPVFIIHGVRK